MRLTHKLAFRVTSIVAAARCLFAERYWLAILCLFVAAVPLYSKTISPVVTYDMYTWTPTALEILSNQQQDPPPCQTCPTPKPQVIYAPIFDLPEASSEIVLNCRSARDLTMTPTFYTLDGEAFSGDSIVLKPAEIRFVDTLSLIPVDLRNAHKWGGISFSYVGNLQEAWAQLTLRDSQGKGSANVLFAVLNQKRSNSNDAVWWLPEKGSALIALGNSSDQPIQVNLIFSNRPSQTLEVAPFGTKIVRLQDGPSVPGRSKNVEAVSLRYTGTAGALISSGFTSFSDGKLAGLIRFYDTQNTVQRNLYASNLRLDDSSPRLVLRNTSPDFITAQAIFLTASGRSEEAIKLPRTRLAPYEVADVKLDQLSGKARERADLSSVSVRVINSGPPGSLIGALYSQNRTTNVTYEVPLRDSGPPRASTGGYPVRLDDDYTTIVSISNTSDKAGQFTMQINHEGAPYVFGLVFLDPGATKTFDVRKLRDEQTPDINGSRLPPGMQKGQVRWSARGNGTVPLNGRAEIVSIKSGVSSSYSCWQCCQNSYEFAIVDPWSTDVVVGDTEGLTAKEHQRDCYGNMLPPFIVYFPDWYSTDEDIATVDWLGDATGESPGYAPIWAEWVSYRWVWDDMDEWCEPFEEYPAAGCNFTVEPPDLSVTEVGFTSDHALHSFPSGTALDNPDGSAPTWKSSGNPDRPAAYTKGTNATIWAKLGISPSTPNFSAKIRVKNGSTVIAGKDITIGGSTITVTGLTTTSALESTVKKTTPTFTWELSYDGGNSWSSIGNTGPHKMFWTNATPLSPSFRGDDGFEYSTLYDIAVQRAVEYSNGASTVGTIATAINLGVEDDTEYDPNQSIASIHPLFGFIGLSPGVDGIQCSDEAELLRGLLRSIGINGTVKYIWAGSSSTNITQYTIGTTGLTFPSFRLIRAANDAAPLNPHFRFHAVVDISSTWYDPSYGLEYSSLSFNETANNNTPQQVHSSRWTPPATQSAFACGHTGIGGQQ